MHVALVLNGEPPTDVELALLDDCDVIVCADGGAHAVLASGRVPTLIVGDLDSLEVGEIERAETAGVRVERHATVKDFTDGELALDAVLARRPRRVTVLGAHGRRMAMLLGNLKLLRRLHDAGVDAVMIGRGEELRFVTGPGRLELQRRVGELLNVLPVGGAATVSVEGTAYDVDRVQFGQASSRGVSNPILADAARVVVHDGCVVTIVETPKATSPAAPQR